VARVWGEGGRRQNRSGWDLCRICRHECTAASDHGIAHRDICLREEEEKGIGTACIRPSRGRVRHGHLCHLFRRHSLPDRAHIARSQLCHSQANGANESVVEYSQDSCWAGSLAVGYDYAGAC
jgi:hypothetical protein